MSKDYMNVIAKPQMVTIPKWEYTGLVRASTILDNVEKVLCNVDEYKALEIIKILVDAESRKEEE